MSTVAFDTYAQFKQLVQTGVPAAQTEAIINAVAGATVLPDISQLATKADHVAVRSEIALLDSNLRVVEANLRGGDQEQQGRLDLVDRRLLRYQCGYHLGRRHSAVAGAPSKVGAAS